jgi:phenylacetate-CoA ligase
MAETRAFYDELETRPPEVRHRAQLSALREQITQARQRSTHYAESLRDVGPDDITDLGDLARLPVLRKGDLVELQKVRPPFAGVETGKPGEMQRIFASPGPIYEFEAARRDYWRAARAFFAAGFRPGEIVHNTLSYHLTPGGWIFDDGARALGCAVVPAGVGNSKQQAEAIAQIRPQGYAGTPDYLKTLLEAGDELGLDLSSITKALVSGGALFPSLRQDYADRDVAMLQCYATADLGLIAYESEAMEGLIADEGLLIEIVRPGTGDPLPDGEVGEVVVTTFNPDYPLIRFGTGDLSAVLASPSPCGRTNLRIKGWMGRADQTAKIKGMFVHPQQVAEVLKAHPEIAKARLVVSRQGDADHMTLRCETASQDDGLAEAVAETLRQCCKMRGAVELVAPGGLPNDGKVIDDQRDYEQGG